MQPGRHRSPKGWAVFWGKMHGSWPEATTHLGAPTQTPQRWARAQRCLRGFFFSFLQSPRTWVEGLAGVGRIPRAAIVLQASAVAGDVPPFRRPPAASAMGGPGLSARPEKGAKRRCSPQPAPGRVPHRLLPQTRDKARLEARQPEAPPSTCSGAPQRPTIQRPATTPNTTCSTPGSTPGAKELQGLEVSSSPKPRRSPPSSRSLLPSAFFMRPGLASPLHLLHVPSLTPQTRAPISSLPKPSSLVAPSFLSTCPPPSSSVSPSGRKPRPRQHLRAPHPNLSSSESRGSPHSLALQDDRCCLQIPAGLEQRVRAAPEGQQRGLLWVPAGALEKGTRAGQASHSRARDS